MKTDYFELINALAFNCHLTSQRIKFLCLLKDKPTAKEKGYLDVMLLPQNLIKDFLPPLGREDIYLICEALKGFNLSLNLLEKEIKQQSNSRKEKFIKEAESLNDLCSLLYDAILKLNRRQAVYEIFKDTATAERITKTALTKSYSQEASAEANCFFDALQAADILRQRIIVTVLKNF